MGAAGAAGASAGISGGSAAGGKIGGMIGGIAGMVYHKKVLAPTLKKLAREEAKEVRRAGRIVGGRQMAGYAKAGVRTDVGTPVQVMAETAARTELAALRAAFSYKQRIYESKTSATFALVTSLLMMGGSLAQGATQARQQSGQPWPSFDSSGAYGAQGSAARGLPYYGIDQGSGQAASNVYTLPYSWDYPMPTYQK